MIFAQVVPSEKQIAAAEVVAEKVADVLKQTSASRPSETLMVVLVIVAMLVIVSVVVLFLRHTKDVAKRVEEVTDSYMSNERTARTECHAHSERMVTKIGEIADDLKGVRDDWKRTTGEVVDVLRQTRGT